LRTPQAGIDSLTVNELRGTRRRIARVGCNITEIYTINGDKLSEAEPAILLAHDLSRGRTSPPRRSAS